MNAQLTLIHENVVTFPRRTYGRLRHASDGKRAAFMVADLAPHVSLRFKRMFGQVRMTQTRDFIITDTPAACLDLAWFIDRFPLSVDENARLRLEAGCAEARRRTAAVDTILSQDWSPDDPTPGFKPATPPYPFQAQAATLAVTMRRLLIMDDIGMGKTVTALAALAQNGQFPAAIIVQAHLAEQWLEEVEEFTTMRAHIIRGTRPYALPQSDIFIFKYSNIAGWVDIAGSGIFKAVVYDEVQELRHWGTAKASAAAVFGRHASLRIGLTATPIYNYGSEIFHVLEQIEPGALGSYDEFRIEWCAERGRHDVVRDPRALGTWLRDAGMAVRRTEADVGKQMPPVNVLTHDVGYDETVAAAVEDEARMLALKVVSGSFTERGQAARELDLLARQATGMAKAAGVAALVRMLVEAGEKVLLAGWHRDVYAKWLKLLGDLNPVMFTGSETPAQKRKAKAAFLADCPLMIISLRSGAGLDGLQHVARTVVIGELDWSPLVHKQLIGRLRRPGQKHQVDAIYAIANGGSDPVMVEMLGLKSSQSHGIVDPLLEQVAPQTSDDSRIKALARAYLQQEKRHD